MLNLQLDFRTFYGYIKLMQALLPALLLPLVAFISAAQEAPLLELLPVHPKSESIIAKLPVDNEGKPILPQTTAWANYRIAPQLLTHEITGEPLRDAKTQKPRVAYLLLTRPHALQAQGCYISAADVQFAQADPTQKDCIRVCLTQEGATRMKKLSGGMQKGVERLAILVKGSVICAPVIQCTLGAEFQISGLNQPNEAQMLAQQLMDKAATKTHAENLPQQVQDTGLRPISPMSAQQLKQIESLIQSNKYASYPDSAEINEQECGTKYFTYMQEFHIAPRLDALARFLSTPPAKLTEAQLTFRQHSLDKLGNSEILLHKQQKMMAIFKSSNSSLVLDEWIIDQLGTLSLIREKDGKLSLHTYTIYKGLGELPACWQSEKEKRGLFSWW